MISKKVLALRSRKDGPKVHVASADRVLVIGLEPGDEIALQCGDACLLSVTEPGLYELKLRKQELYVKRIKGTSPVDVFVERDICH